MLDVSGDVSFLADGVRKYSLEHIWKLQLQLCHGGIWASSGIVFGVSLVPIGVAFSMHRRYAGFASWDR